MSFEINKRIQSFIDSLEITPYEFSKRMGNKRPDGLYKILDLKTKPSPKTLEKIKNSYPELNYSWLLTGEGSMKKNGKTSITEEPGVTYEDDVTLTSLKKDLNQLSVGITENFEVLSEGIFQTLQRQEKIIDFIENINAEEISKATKALSKYLQEHK